MSRIASPSSILRMTRLIVSSASSSEKCALRQSKNFISVRRRLSYFSPARSESGSRQARNRASASALSVHSDGDCRLKEAEECFHQSIQIARRQSAKSLELRAVLSLSRLWQRQNKTKEARQTLLEIYNWFTEGFDTEDLKEARALLEELS